MLRRNTGRCHATQYLAGFFTFVLLLVGLMHCATASAGKNQMDAGTRMALVIGNGEYNIAPLKNPVNDARAMSDSLRSLGFEVTLEENGTLREMIESIRAFSLASRKSKVRLFYYAGHGFQLSGKNYLLPVDTEATTIAELSNKSVDINELLQRLQNMEGGVNLVILDACRTHPYLSMLPVGRGVRGLGTSNGLAQVMAPKGTLIAFSTAPNSIANDGNAQNSTYTKYLLSYISSPGLPIEQLLKRVRIAVAEETRDAQIPWESSSLTGDFCFKPGPNGRCMFVDSEYLAPTALPQIMEGVTRGHKR